MKKIVYLITMLVFLLSVAKGFADSPITTADVYKAYVNLKMVQVAKEEGNLNQDILDFLADEKNSIDEKMAVVNAIFSSGEAFSINESLAQKYVTYVYDESLQDLNGKDLLGYEWFIVAYLDAMQNYNAPSTSDTFMENALLFNEDSLVANLVYALYKTHYKIMVGEHSSDDIYNYWNMIMESISEGVKELDIEFDIRAEALEYYFKYMIMPENTIFNLELDPIFVMLESGQSFEIKVYGGVTPFDVEILSGDADVSFDGVNLIVKGNSKGQTNYVIRDKNGVSVKGSVYVKGTREDLYKEILVKFLLDKDVFWINGEEMEIDAVNPVKPVLNEDGRTLIPIRAFIESVGGIVGWNAEDREVIISLNGNALNLTLDESIAYFNGEAFKLDTQPTIVNNRTMVPLRFVSEKLGFDVNWVASERKINIEALSRIQNLEYLQLNGNHINYGYVVSDDDYLFYLDKSEEDYNLVRKNKDNGDVEVIFEGDVNYLNLHQEHLYFRDDSSKLFRVNKDGDNPQLVIDTPINEYFIVDDKLFFTAGVIDESLIKDSSSSDFNTLLYSIDLRNNDATPELLYARDVWDLNTDGSYLYFRHLMQSQADEGIYRINLDGSDFTKVMDDFVYMYVLRDDEVFYLDSDWGLKKFSFSDGKQKQIIDGNVYSFNISKNHIAYLSLDDNSIYVSDLYGRDKRKIRGIPERTIVDLNFLDDSLFVFFDFSASHTTARMDNFVLDLNEIYTIRPESEKFYITDDIIRQMLKEQLDEPKAGERVALIETTFGTIKMRLFDKEAPKAVGNFIALSNQGYYDGVSFHRIFDDFLIQTGDPKGDGTGGESVWGEVFQDEIHPGRLNLRGAVSMANMGPNTNGSQFFIVQKPEVEEFITEQMKNIGYESYVIEKYKDVGGAPWLDGTHTVFGQVFEGLDVVDQIASVNMIDVEQGIPKDEVNIISVEIKIW